MELLKRETAYIQAAALNATVDIKRSPKSDSITRRLQQTSVCREENYSIMGRESTHTTTTN